MIKSIKNIFSKGSVSERPPITQIPPRTTMQLGVPTEFIDNEYLNELKVHFTELAYIKRAAYVLACRSGEFSYVVALDLELPREKLDEAISLTATYVRQNSKKAFSARYPLDFGLWQNFAVPEVLNQNSQLYFYQR